MNPNLQVSRNEVGTKPHVGNFRWVVIFMGFLLITINYIDRTSMAIAAPILSKQFHLSPSEMGLILGAFFWGTMVFVFFGGVIVDRVGPKKTWAFFAVAWSILLATTPFMWSFVSFMVIRTIFGMAESPGFSALNKVVSRWVNPNENAKAVGIIIAGVGTGLTIAGPVCSQLIIHFGWKPMFYILGILGVLWVAVWLLIFSDDPHRNRFVSKEESNWVNANSSLQNSEHCNNYFISWKVIFKNGSLWANAWAYFVFLYSLSMLLNWLPSYLTTERHLNLSQMGFLVSIPWLAAAISSTVGGVFSDWITSKTNSLRIGRGAVGGIGLLCSGIGFYVAANASTSAEAIIFLTLSTLFGFVPNVIFFSVVLDMVPSKAGAYTGFLIFFADIGQAAAPIITGFIVQSTHTFSSAFIITGILLTTGAAAMFFVRPRRIDLKSSEV